MATVRTPNDVRAVCASTSVLVASYEAVVGEKIVGITRRPANVEERAKNCDLVIDRLQENVLGTDLAHISGMRITQGNLQDTYDLLGESLSLFLSLSLSLTRREALTCSSFTHYVRVFF